MAAHSPGGVWGSVARRLESLVRATVTTRQDQAVVLSQALDLLEEVVPEADAAISVATAHASAQIVASSTQLAELAGLLEHERRQGPTVEALERSTMVHVPDMARETRWPEVAPKLAEAGIGSALCLSLCRDDEQRAALSLYAGSAGAFDEQAHHRVAAAGAALTLVLYAVAYRDLVDQLAEAVLSNREIGIATGVVMARRRTTRDQAFAALREASERQHRKLRDVARSVLYSGDLVDPDPPTTQ